MPAKDYKAFIVEGEVREPQVINNISKVFFSHGNFEIITLPAGENIYMLWKELQDDDFDTDIIEVLRERNVEIARQLAGLSRDDFSEVYLFFDYDAHQTNLGNDDGEDVICQMLESFDNETENGKLYISYPMVEALRDYMPELCGRLESCFIPLDRIVEYKTDSAQRSFNPHFKDYDFSVWKDIANVFAMRVACLFSLDRINYAQYRDDVSPAKIYTEEVRALRQQGVFVLSAFPEFLFDYFGEKLWKKCVKNSGNMLETGCCRS